MLILLNTFLSSLIKFVQISFLRSKEKCSGFIMFFWFLNWESMFSDTFCLSNCSIIVVSFWLIKELSEFLMHHLIVFRLLNRKVINPIKLLFSWLFTIDMWVDWNSVLHIIFNVRIDRLFIFQNSKLIILEWLVKELFVKCCVLSIECWRRDIESLIPCAHIRVSLQIVIIWNFSSYSIDWVLSCLESWVPRSI